MPIPSGIPFDYREKLNKLGILVGIIIIIIYALLWIVAKLGWIPLILFAIFPQIVLLLIGVFIVYMAVTANKRY